MSSFRFFQIYVIQTIVGVLFFFIAYKILKRGSGKRLNKIFASFFIFSGGIPPVINWIYAPIEFEALESLVSFLSILSFYFIALGLIFLLLFIMIIDKSEKVITNSKQILIVVIYGAALIVLFLIPGGITVDILDDPVSGWTQKSPVWNITALIYVLAIIVGIIIVSLKFSLGIYKKFEDESLQKKWRFFIIGVVLYESVAIIIATINYINIDGVRTLAGLVQLVLVVVGAVLVYYGVGKQV